MKTKCFGQIDFLHLPGHKHAEQAAKLMKPNNEYDFYFTFI